MPTTTNYGWTTPADTDLVKDGAAAIRTLGSSIDSTLKTQIDAQIPDSLLTTTGDTIYATGASTPARLPIGSTGQVLTVAGGVPTWATQSSASTTFTQKYTPSTIFNVYAGATNGTTIIVFAGASGNLISSTDSGATWTARTSGFGANGIYGLAFGNGTFVAVGQNGTITSSTDGITWTARTSGVSTNLLNSVSYLNGTFVAVGAGAAGGTGGVTTSTDGITWTKRTTPTLTSSALYSVTFGNGYYVAVGTNNTTSGIYSTNLSTWTALPTTITSSLNFIDYQNSQFIGLTASDQTIWYTGNNPTTGWGFINTAAPFISPTQNDLSQLIKPYNSRYYYTTTNVNMIPQIYSVSTALSATSGVGFTTDYMPIPVPTRIWTNEVSFTTINCFVIQNNGKFVLINQRARVFVQD